MNNNEQPNLQIVSKDGIISARQMVDENFKGLDELIVDMELTDWYKDLIVECIEGYHAQFSHPQEPQVKSAEDGKINFLRVLSEIRKGFEEKKHSYLVKEIDYTIDSIDRFVSPEFFASQFKSEPKSEPKTLTEHWGIKSEPTEELKEEINIQDELVKIHHQYGTSEKANYQIQLLFERLKSEPKAWTPPTETEIENQAEEYIKGIMGDEMYLPSGHIEPSAGQAIMSYVAGAKDMRDQYLNSQRKD